MTGKEQKKFMILEGEGEVIQVASDACYERRPFRIEFNPSIIRRFQILVVKIDLTRRMEYQKDFLERRHIEVYT